MLAMVPSTVATTEATSAMTSEMPRALRIISLRNRFRYQSSVKPVKRVRLLDWLKLNTAITAIGTYIKEKIRIM